MRFDRTISNGKENEEPTNEQASKRDCKFDHSIEKSIEILILTLCEYKMIFGFLNFKFTNFNHKFDMSN